MHPAFIEAVGALYVRPVSSMMPNEYVVRVVPESLRNSADCSDLDIMRIMFIMSVAKS